MHYPDRPIAAALAARLVLAAIVVLVSAGSATAQQTVTIEIFNFDFGDHVTGHIDPTIQVGDTIHWVWVTGFHSTTSLPGQTESWDSGVQAPPFTFDHTFTNPGDFTYICSLHGFNNGDGTASGMHGIVHVVPVPEPPLVLLIVVSAGGLILACRRRVPMLAWCGVGRRRSAFSLVERIVQIHSTARGRGCFTNHPAKPNISARQRSFATSSITKGSEG